MGYINKPFYGRVSVVQKGIDRWDWRIELNMVGGPRDRLGYYYITSINDCKTRESAKRAAKCVLKRLAQGVQQAL